MVVARGPLLEGPRSSGQGEHGGRCTKAPGAQGRVRPHRRQPTRLPCPWDAPGKNTGVGCHFLLQCNLPPPPSPLSSPHPRGSPTPSPLSSSSSGPQLAPRPRYLSLTSLASLSFWARLLTGPRLSRVPQCSCLEHPRDRGAWWAAVSGVAQSWTHTLAQSCLTLYDPMDCSLPACR